MLKISTQEGESIIIFYDLFYLLEMRILWSDTDYKDYKGSEISKFEQIQYLLTQYTPSVVNELVHCDTYWKSLGRENPLFRQWFLVFREISNK